MSKTEIEILEETNTMEVRCGSAGVRTLDELLELAEVDLDVWEVARHEINSWPTSMKDENGEPMSVINWQVKAQLIRKEPILIMPAVQPMQINPRNIPRTKGRGMRDIKIAVVLPDPQFGFDRDMRTGEMTPYHDRAALDVALQITQHVNPDVVVWLGDMLDLPDWSNKFIRSPEMYWTTQSAIVEANWWLSQFRKAAVGADHYLLEGNHDKRMETAVIERLAAAYDLKSADELHLPPNLSVPRLLALHELGIEYVSGYPDGQVWLNDSLVCEHGLVVSGQSGATVRKVADKRDVSVIHGHIHRREWASRTIHRRHGRKVVDALCPGCLCDVSGRVPGRQKAQNWQQGLAVVRYTDAHKELVPVAIDNGRAIFEGGLWSARSQIGRIKRDSKWQAL